MESEAGCRMSLPVEISVGIPLGHTRGNEEDTAHLAVQGDDHPLLARAPHHIIDSGKHVNRTHDAITKFLHRSQTAV